MAFRGKIYGPVLNACVSSAVGSYKFFGGRPPGKWGHADRFLKGQRTAAIRAALFGRLDRLPVDFEGERSDAVATGIGRAAVEPIAVLFDPAFRGVGKFAAGFEARFGFVFRDLDCERFG